MFLSFVAAIFRIAQRVAFYIFSAWCKWPSDLIFGLPLFRANACVDFIG